MKNIITRVLAIALLATSASAFALPEAKASDNCAADSSSQNVSRHKGSDSGMGSNKKSKNVEDQQQKDYDRALLGIYG